MVNNYDDVLLALSNFILTNAPAGGERELARMAFDIERGSRKDFFGIDFRPTDDTSCTLYVRVVSPDGTWCSSRQLDSESNEWSSFKVTCEVSWASFGSGDLVTTQRRLALMTAVTRFACEIERAFPNVFHRMDATASEVQVRKAKLVKDRAKNQVIDLIKKNAKGMKVGQEKIVPVFGADFREICPFDVDRVDVGRSFKYRATATSTDGFAFVRVA
jgi:hypothetical protein